MSQKRAKKVRLDSLLVERGLVEAVSYTHLDVYKRQGRNSCHGEDLCPERTAF